MIKLSYITKEEQKKFKELLDKEKRDIEKQKFDKEFFIEQLSERVDNLLDLNKSYGPIEAYSVTFSKFLTNDFKAHETDTLHFKWSEIKRYLTSRCLARDKGGWRLKKVFREHLLDRGFKTRINRRWDTFQVKKTSPRKRVKK